MIQYIIAAGIGAFLGSRSKKSKKSYAHGGEVGKTYEIKGVDVTYYEDSYEEGELDQFHSYYLGQSDFPYKTEFSSKKDLFNTLNEFISYGDFSESDFFVDEDTIQTNALVKFEKDSDWDEFSAPTEKEKELWRKGKMKLYSALFVFPYEVYKKEKLDFAKGGEVDDLEYSEIYDVLKDKIEDAAEDISSTYEQAYDSQGEEVEHKSRSGFIPYTDGGFKSHWFEYINMLSGSGTSLPTSVLDKEMQRQVDYNYELAKDRFVEENEELVKEIGEDKVNYHDLYELGYGGEAESLSEMESDMGDDSILMEVEAMYYAPHNDRGIDGKNTIRLSGSVNLEAPYHRRGNLDDYIETEFTFNSVEELETKMDSNLKKVVGWFEGDNYSESKRELKIRRMAKGGAVRTNSKAVREKVRKHILESVYDVNEEEFDNIDDASEYITSEFKRVADYPANKHNIPNHQDRFEDYLRGIPFNFEYENWKIEEFLNGLGINPQAKEYGSDQMWKLYSYLIWKEVNDKYQYAKGGMTEHGLEIGDKIVSEKDNAVLVWGQGEKNASIVNLDKGIRANFAKGGKTQGYNDRLDESLSMRDGAGRKKQQGRKDRRDESAGMEKSMGRKKYASVGTMDKKSKILPRPAKDYIAYVIDMEGNATLKYSKTFQGANRMMQNLMKRHQDISTHGISKYDPFYGTHIGESISFEPIKGFAKGGKTQGYDDRGDEELGMTEGKESRFQQSKKDRRDEMKGENRSAGNKTYGSFEKGGETNWVQEVVDSPDFRKGAFTKKAKERGLTPEEFMRKVLKNPDKYNERTRRQAQFMKNIGD